MTNDCTVRMKRRAMGCEFELVLCGRNREHLVDAANEAFEELVRLEEQMSVFIPTSEISYINASAAEGPVRVEPRLFDLLRTAARLSRETDGAFDVSAGPLVKLWGFSNNSDDFTIPSEDEIGEIVKRVGMSHVEFDEKESTIRFDSPGVELDLGAIGKGYAVREMVSLLHERGVAAGLVSGGPSTVYAMASPPDDDAWTVGIRSPVNRADRITTVRLKNQALSTSGGHERFVEADGRRYGHVIDPRTGHPAHGLLAASAVTSDPTRSDALSTAFLVLGVEKTREYCRAHDDVRAILVPAYEPGSGANVVRIGFEQ